MRVRNLDKIFRPQRIAVIGASERPDSLGYAVLRNLISAGFRGVVYPVNPNREAVHGILAFPDVASLPKTPDLAVVAVRAALVPQIVGECGAAGVGGLIIFSAGFREVGEKGRALEEQIQQQLSRYPAMRIIGPNCLGVMVPSIGLNATFANTVPKPGSIAFLSQSGPLCTSVLDWALHQDVGFSLFVSVGNTLDVSIGDLIDYAGQNPHTESIILYAESITDARKFMSASRAFARSKPIAVYKTGRFAESARAAASHTGALAADDEVYDAAFRRAGIVRVYDVHDMFECAQLLARRRTPRGARLAIVTNAGGPGVMAVDRLMARHGALAALSPDTMEKLNELLPPFWSHGNPVDLGCDATPQRYAIATEIILADEQVDAALVILTPNLTNPAEQATAVAEVQERSRKPLLAAWMGAASVAEAVRILTRAGIPTYSSPERAVNAFMYLVSYSRNIETLYETPREIPVSFALDRKRPHLQLQEIRRRGEKVLTEAMSKTLLEAYGIPIAPARPAGSVQEAVHTARQLGYPVVLKVLSPQITHKTDVDGVALDLRDDDDVVLAYRRIVETASKRQPQARIDGVTVQPMIPARNGIELILGARKDPIFGSVILIGAGGTTAGLYGDRVLGLPPLNERLARRMLESLKCRPILEGFRGKPRMNLDKLIEILMRLSYLVADHPQIEELDVNPLLVTAEEVIALDARVILTEEPVEEHALPFAHLAIPPWPEHYVRHSKLRDGSPLLLRPIKPEDEPMWHELLTACSAESIRGRFHSLFHGTTHDMAARACFIDYDREMAIVAEIGFGESRRLIGVARLVADPDHDVADFGILIADPWQGQGLGRQLTEYCLQIAEDWQLNRVTAITGASNPKMVKIFQKLGFEIGRDPEDDVVSVSKVLKKPAAATPA